ncbi:MAG TPA: EF-hand domain-containing protein [Luteimonas sp.]|nr:EF-hand domain-containing protein [Luteimonas sp.]
MMTSRHSLFLATAITAALAAPLAFAQSDNATQGSASAQAATSATPATPATPAMPPTDNADAMAATPATPATPAEPASSAKKISWSDLDGDKDGKLTKTEAGPVDSLSQVFDQADADKDGALTAKEYKAWLAANGNARGGHS